MAQQKLDGLEVSSGSGGERKTKWSSVLCLNFKRVKSVHFSNQHPGRTLVCSLGDQRTTWSALSLVLFKLPSPPPNEPHLPRYMISPYPAYLTYVRCYTQLPCRVSGHMLIQHPVSKKSTTRPPPHPSRLQYQAICPPPNHPKHFHLLSGNCFVLPSSG